jgi:hypothetical protein
VTTGRTDITRRALERTVAAVASDAFGVGRRDVRVRLADERGALAVAIAAPLTPGRTPVGLQSLAAALSERIGDRAERLTGMRIGAVRLTITGLSGNDERRVA